jgi:hypothetical protein
LEKIPNLSWKCGSMQRASREVLLSHSQQEAEMVMVVVSVFIF